MHRVLRHLRRAALLSAGDGPSDAQLLESFLARRDEAAFEALLRRHGPMVLGVCRRVLRNAHDAEDAFQATFLVLARKAGSIRSWQVVAGWLYGVAYRTARKARAMNAKRRAKERQLAETSRPNAPTGRAWEELLAHLDHELSRLPDKYRVPVILCELEGKSRKEVARLLGVPEGTLSWRLAQARKMLAKRLSRYRIELSAGALGAVLSSDAMPECLSAALRKSTAEAALTAGAVPAQVLALTEGVMRSMLLTKLKITTCFAALMLLAGVGATGLTYRATAQEPKRESLSFGTFLEARQAPDDLESLRLEIEALRKELRATRERVKELEGQMRALQGRGGMKMRDGGGAGGAGAGQRGTGGGGGGPGGGPAGGEPGGPGRGGNPAGLTKPPLQKESASELVDEAEAALKKLRQGPIDKEAAEALERALKLLKEREKAKAAKR